MVLASTLEPLRDVKLRAIDADFKWRVTTVDGMAVKTSSGISIQPDSAFVENGSMRTLVLVAGYHIRDQVSKELSSKLRRAIRGADAVIAVDTAPWLLASAGLLDGQSATIHWQELDAFKEMFPRVRVSSKRFVQSGPFLTCGGASTAMDMILEVIKTRFGAAAAFDASNMFIYDPSRQMELGRGAQKLQRIAPAKLLAALDVMAQNIEQPLTTFELAEQVSMSERSLNRTFQNELGMTPGKYYRLFRLQKARHLAEETNLSQEQIALRCGFSSGATLARSFVATFAQSIKEIRSA